MQQFSFCLGLVSEVLVTSSGAKWGHVALYCLCRELTFPTSPKENAKRPYSGSYCRIVPLPDITECIWHKDCHIERGNGTLESGIALRPSP